MARILVTGGAGYIGSHACLAFLEHGHEVVVLDDLSTGRPFLIPDDVRLVRGDVGDRSVLAALLANGGVDAVIHFAGSIVVPESVVDPLKYYDNNTARMVRLLQACVAHGVDKVIFSSTAAVYGSPARVPVGEDAPTEPINPYGRSKLMSEWVLRDTALAADLRYVALRYFNVAGADPLGRAGQSQAGATHLIKVACECATGQRRHLEIFGEDYPTPDGTCIRDYVHVTDLAEAHVLAYEHLAGGGASEVLNCGYGRGYSVRQVLDAMQRLGAVVEARGASRRAGDPPRIVAEAARIRRVLGWRPRHGELEVILRTALAWERALQERRRPALAAHQPAGLE